MGVYTGTVPTFLAGELPDADKFTEVSNFMTAATAAWSTWSPTLTALTLGNGSVVARYRQLGKTVDYRFKFTLGSTSAVGSSPQFTLPVAPSGTAHTGGTDHVGVGAHTDAATAQYESIVKFVSGSTAQIDSYGTTGVIAVTSATVPFTWGTGDSMEVWGTYETA